MLKFILILFTLFLYESEAFIGKACKVEVVVLYFEPLAIKVP